MKEQDRRERVREFQERCRREGIPFTVQRQKTYESLLLRNDHPTADRVYEDVRVSLPGMSRMTVYRVLELLVRFGLVKKVCHPGSAARYDPNRQPHHHLVCLRCDKLIDFEESAFDELKAPPEARRLGFEVNDHLVQFRGVCAECARKGASPG
ncbi:MAG: transcriptional repressor [Candidatus Eisenbacteria bacterium]|nr:transcriptional repressor [Candidatus Eisenbacteria bacterium]